MDADLRAQVLALCEAVNRMHLAISELGLATKAQALRARLAGPPTLLGVSVRTDPAMPTDEVRLAQTDADGNVTSAARVVGLVVPPAAYDCAPVADALNSWCREAHVEEAPSAKWQDVRAAVYRLWDKLGSLRPAPERPPLDRETLQGLFDGWLADHRECLTFGDYAVEYLARLAGKEDASGHP